jgi:hypothetical protein
MDNSSSLTADNNSIAFRVATAINNTVAFAASSIMQSRQNLCQFYKEGFVLFRGVNIELRVAKVSRRPACVFEDYRVTNDGVCEILNLFSGFEVSVSVREVSI